MVAPNLKSLTSITGKSASYAATATLSEALANALSTNKALKINSIRAANVDPLSYTLDISFYNGTTHIYLCKDLQVGSNSSVIILSKDEYLYLEEGQSIHVKASVANKINLIFSYEELA